VALLIAAGLTTRESIDATSLKAASGIGPAIAAKVLDALERTDHGSATGKSDGMPQGVTRAGTASIEEDAGGGPPKAETVTMDDGGVDLETSLLRNRGDGNADDRDTDLLFTPGPAPVAREVAEGPPTVVPVFGGHLLIEKLSGDRRRATCPDPWLADRFDEACSALNVALAEDASAVLPYETCKLLVAGMKDASIRKELRTWSHQATRPPSLVTAHGRIAVTVFMSAGGPIAAVKPLENDGRIENRMDLVCPALGGRWSDEKSTWSIPEGRLQDLARAMDVLPEGSPPAPAELRRAAAADRRPPAAEKDGLAYAIDENGKADKDWYRRSGRREDVEVLGGLVHVYHVDDRTWLAAKHDGDGEVNAAIKDAVARISGYQGYHGPLNGHKFPASDGPKVIAELRRIDSQGRAARLI
jgi:hypothetical protein